MVVPVSEHTTPKKENKMTKKTITLTKEQKDKLQNHCLHIMGLIPPPKDSCPHPFDHLDETTGIFNSNDQQLCSRYVRCRKCLFCWRQRKDTGAYETLTRDNQEVVRSLWCSDWEPILIPDLFASDGEAKGLVQRILDSI